MPELPDIVVYLEALQSRVVGTQLERIRLASPFLLRTVDPSVSEVEGKQVLGLRRLGKRIIFCLPSDLFVILHLMIAGRLHWQAHGAKLPRKLGLAAFDFSSGTLTLTEAGSKKRASVHIVRGEDSLHQHDPGGLEVLSSSLAEFRQALCRENHTLKRALTDPRLFSGIGNAYSDEILHAARLSPTALTQKLGDEEISRLHESVRRVLDDWTTRLRKEAGSAFPEKVTAFREEMAVHGRFGLPCPVCGTKVQRIVYAENETNYCPRCQTGGKLMADRSLSRLLHDDWPRTIDEIEGEG
jgi:formamidopyrimidine-DNA glycosylase